MWEVIVIVSMRDGAITSKVMRNGEIMELFGRSS